MSSLLVGMSQINDTTHIKIKNLWTDLDGQEHANEGVLINLEEFGPLMWQLRAIENSLTEAPNKENVKSKKYSKTIIKEVFSQYAYEQVDSLIKSQCKGCRNVDFDHDLCSKPEQFISENLMGILKLMDIAVIKNELHSKGIIIPNYDELLSDKYWVNCIKKNIISRLTE